MQQHIKSNKAFTLIELLTVIAIIAVLFALVGGPLYKMFGGKGFEYSDGQRSGLVYKISKKGVTYKTWEGELSLQMTTRDSHGIMVNQVFNFSVSDDNIARQIEAVPADKSVTLVYKQYLLRGYRYGSTSYDIVGVK